MEVSPKELMDILNKIISKRKGPRTLEFDLTSKLLYVRFDFQTLPPKRITTTPLNLHIFLCHWEVLVSRALRYEQGVVRNLTHTEAGAANSKQILSQRISITNGWWKAMPFHTNNTQIIAIKSYLQQHILSLVSYERIAVEVHTRPRNDVGLGLGF